MPRVIIDIEAEDLTNGSGIRIAEEGRLRREGASDLAAVPSHLGVAVRRALLAVAGLDGYDEAARVVVERLGLGGGEAG